MTSSVLPRAAYVAATLVITALPRRPPRAGGPAGQGRRLEQEPARPRRGILRPRPAGLAEGPGARVCPHGPSPPTPFTLLLTAIWILSSPQTPPRAHRPSALSTGDFWEEPPAAHPLTSQPLPQTLGCRAPGLLRRAAPALLPHMPSEGPGVAPLVQAASSEGTWVTLSWGGQSVTHSGPKFPT